MGDLKVSKEKLLGSDRAYVSFRFPFKQNRHAARLFVNSPGG